jgi:hypothetical protein
MELGNGYGAADAKQALDLETEADFHAEVDYRIERILEDEDSVKEALREYCTLKLDEELDQIKQAGLPQPKRKFMYLRKQAC